MGRESVCDRGMNTVGECHGMPFLLKTGILVFLITSVVGRALEEKNNTTFNSTSYIEEPSENECNCEWRYYKHYEAKRCQLVQVNSCGCPKKYLCPLLSDTNEEKKICIYQNQEYAIGTRINITDKCQSCRCVGGEQTQIVCRHKECPQLDSVVDQNCHLVYENDRCCPTKYECVLGSIENAAKDLDSFCMYDGISYPFGAKIYPSDDPCLICQCSESWNGISNTSCYEQDCLFEKNKSYFNRGCVPVYHEKKCCPIEFYCPENLVLNDVSSEYNFLNSDSENLEHSCTFDGKSFEIGKELLMENPCIKCTCIVPPDFTCVHQSCPKLPIVENCQVLHSSNYCCPFYSCTREDLTSIDTSNSSEIVCPTPICADETCVIKVPEGHQCPTCVCDDSNFHETNIFEPNEELILEGSLKNGSFSENIEEDDGDKFDSEVLIPIESEFSSQNRSSPIKFLQNSDEKEHLEYDKAEDSEHEVDITSNNFETETKANQNSEESFNDESEYINLETFEKANSNDSKHEEGLINVRRKRSSNFRTSDGIPMQQQNSVQSNQYDQSQQQFFEEDDNENNREISDDSDESFDELKLSSMNKKTAERKLDEEELFSSESVIVPAGCPTPLCANSSCKIEIPLGHRCPTCICKSRENWQP